MINTRKKSALIGRYTMLNVTIVLFLTIVAQAAWALTLEDRMPELVGQTY
jgi:hypothetical protein